MDQDHDLGRQWLEAMRRGAFAEAWDLVISIDSMVAHLAGALGAPVWLLLHSRCDWRWLQARADSPWYPTMRLFRQERAGDWRAPIAAIGAALLDGRLRAPGPRCRDRASRP